MATNGHAAEEPTVLTNKAAREELINKGLRTILAQQEVIDDAILTHVQPLKDKLKELKRKLKADTNIPWTHIKPMYDQLRLVSAAMESEDVDEHEVIDNIREVYESLGVGETVDFIGILGHQAEAVQDHNAQTQADQADGA